MNINRKRLYALVLFCQLTTLWGYNLAADVFPLVGSNLKAFVSLDANEATVVVKAVHFFCDDVKEISGQSLSIKNDLPSEGNVVVVGTLDKSPQLKQLVRKYKINTDSIVGKWEAFSIQLIHRVNGNLLLVIGSDRRGTAYGVLELSRMMGVSPWTWWADVKPTQRTEINLNIPKLICQKPSVQYRGIFLNDEDWGLKPWASKTFDPKVGEIGPKTYAKIFELLLRLRANTIWPAMHECTTPFYFVKGNAAMADSFGIIISTSHCEPLMRSNPLEWNHKTSGDYNFFTNREKVTNYWDERLKEVSNYENVYTVGMRGIHDGAMEGAKTVQRQVEGLTDVFKAQRTLLTDNLHKPVDKIPQIFIPYKEVLDAYNAGLKVPDDVTLLWCDDNYGYLTRLSNAEEQKRKGGSGVYYHMSYWGRPHDYLWLATTQPSFVWTEMQKAWAYGARKMWIVNVGDIKPAEYLTEFYLDMAWDINSIKENQISQHLESWFGKKFGKEQAVQFKYIMNEYYRLAFIRRPEFMGWNQTEPTTKVRETDLNPSEFGNEIETRLQQYAKIEQQAIDLEKSVPERLKNAYFELLKYPVCGAAEMNKKWLNWQLANEYLSHGLKSGEIEKQKSLAAYAQIQHLTSFYNDSIENGKWKLIMSSAPRKLPVFDKPPFKSVSADSLGLPTRNDSINLGLIKKSNASQLSPDFVRLKASEFSKNTSAGSSQWKSVDALGYSQSAMLLQPFAAKLSANFKENPTLEYEFSAPTDSATVSIYLLPTHALDGGNNQRIAVSIDQGEAKTFNINTAGRSNSWKENVLRNQAVVKLSYKIGFAGKHVLKIYAIDPDMIIDQLLIDFKPGRKFYGVGEI